MPPESRHARPINDRALLAFVERIGLTWEREGLPRIAGRIVGLLLVTPGACSLDDLAHSLGVSKASVSTDARRLEQLGFLERASFSGDRRDYYRVAPDLGARTLEIRLARLRQLRRLLSEAPRAATTPDVAARLDAFERLQLYAEEAVEQVLERWKRDSDERSG
jgi:DNA-binding transcriptional regulator GbsR (MarR family)